MDFAAISRTFADTAVTALWQSAALAVALTLCLRLTPRTSAADRFRIWAAGFAAVIVLPLLPIAAGFIHHIFGNTTGAASTVAVGVPAHPWLELSARWSFAIAALWLTASLARAADLLVHSFRLRGLWKRAMPVSFDDIEARSFDVCTTRDLDRPSVIGFFRPRILIPEWLLDRLTPAELKQVVLHEAEHLRRRDDWSNLLQKLCLVVFPLNPALVWMERRLCHEREMACDEGVVRMTHAPRAYAACLTSLAQRGLEHGSAAAALSLGAWQRRSELVRRVHRILRHTPGLSPAAGRALLGVVACGLVIGAAEFARCPQLVEFAVPKAQASVAPVNTNGATNAPAMAGFRAVDAVAHVPTRAEMAEMRVSAAAQNRRVSDARLRRASAIAASASEASDRDASPAPVHNSHLIAGQTEAASSAAPAAPQQMIVFTAWEQIETTAAATPASQSEDSSGQAQTAAHSTPQQVSRQYTVTRLILRVYPAGTAGTSSKSAPSPGPLPSLPAAVPLRDGWLVFQL